MLNFFAKRNLGQAGAENLYRAIVARARHRDLYAAIGVPDTLDGRYELLMLHVILVIRRLRDADERTLAQAVFDLMFADMDQALREMGVSDISVARRIRPMAEAYYGRSAAYEAALAGDAPENALIETITRNAFPDGDDRAGAVRLAAYAARLVTALDQASAGDVATGQIGWPDPVVS